jgi:hypothetical protein
MRDDCQHQIRKEGGSRAKSIMCDMSHPRPASVELSLEFSIKESIGACCNQDIYIKALKVI